MLNIPKRTESQLHQSLTQTLAQRQTPGPVHLFVYGLLAYQPPFTFTSQTSVTLNGYQRRFNLRDPLNRGTPAQPGLTLGLEEGGTCPGISYQLPESGLEENLTKVWQQEMLPPFYIPTWLDIDGTETLVMLTDPTSPAITGPLELLEVTRIIANAKGEAGTNLEYLENVIEAFAREGLKDSNLTSILQTLQSSHAA